MFYYTVCLYRDEGVERDPTMLNLQGLNQWASSYTLPSFHSAQSTLNKSEPLPYTENYFMVSHIFSCKMTNSLFQPSVIQIVTIYTFRLDTDLNFFILGSYFKISVKWTTIGRISSFKWRSELLRWHIYRVNKTFLWHVF